MKTRGMVRTRRQEQDNKAEFIYFEKKVGVTAEPPAPHYHVARILSCPSVSELEPLEAAIPSPRLKAILKAHFKNAHRQRISLGR
jgi:hypothetical protein